MSDMLTQAIAALHLQPGDIFTTTVEGKAVELRMLGPKEAAPVVVEYEPSPYENMEMVEPWFAIPRSEPGISVRVQFGPSRLPDPPIIPSDDESE